MTSDGSKVCKYNINNTNINSHLKFVLKFILKLSHCEEQIFLYQIFSWPQVRAVGCVDAEWKMHFGF